MFKSNGFTRHGHPMTDFIGVVGKKPETVARCGGPTICKECSADVAKFIAENTPTVRNVKYAWSVRPWQYEKTIVEISENDFDAWLANEKQEAVNEVINLLLTVGVIKVKKLKGLLNLTGE